jgi:hypothetical protein
VVFRATSTDTGNFTITQVPIGSYELTATVQDSEMRSPEHQHNRGTCSVWT